MSATPLLDAVALTAGVTIAVLAVTLGAVALIMRVLRPLDRGGPDGGEDSGDGGRGVPRGPTPPPDGGGGGEPAWWPEFEAEFADYVGRRRRRRLSRTPR